MNKNKIKYLIIYGGFKNKKINKINNFHDKNKNLFILYNQI